MSGTEALFDARRRLFDWAHATDDTPVGRDVLAVLENHTRLEQALAAFVGAVERENRSYLVASKHHPMSINVRVCLDDAKELLARTKG